MLPLQTLNPLQIVKYYRSISFHHLTEIWRSPQCLTCDTPHATIEKMYPDKDTFLVEIRLARTKWRIKSHIRTIADMFRLNDCMEIHPHITLYGPLTLCNDSTVEDLMTAIDRVVSVYSGPIPFTIAGYERRDGLHGGVIAFGVRPSGALCTLTRSLSREMESVACSLNIWDSHPENKWFHVTIANRIDREYSFDVFARIQDIGMQTDKPHISTWGFVQSLLQSVISSVRKPERYSHPIFLDDAGMRITIMHGQEIFAEYDLISKRWFTGEDITNKHYWKQSMMKYRLLSGFEQHHEIPFPPGEIFAIADLHFGHANIIRYCSRPFEYNDVKEMDEVLIQNWNSTVGKDHCIFFCGDLSWGKDSKSASDYLSMLNGRITCIPGNHDTGFSSEPEYQVLEHEGLSFCLVHDPERAPKDFCGWVVHGHHHNNDLESYPFFHPGKRRINVSAEVVGYTPVPFSELVRLIRERGDKPGEIVYLRYPYIQEYGENLQDNGTSQAI